LLCKEKGGRAVFSKAVGLLGGLIAGLRRKNASEDLRGFHDSRFHDKIEWLIVFFLTIIPDCIQNKIEKTSEWRRSSTASTVRSRAAQSTKILV
jgi:hypothetical protein